MENLVKIKQGIDSVEVVNIMGAPFKIWSYDDEKIFIYETPPMYSEAIKIVFDSSGRVMQDGRFYHPE